MPIPEDYFGAPAAAVTAPKAKPARQKATAPAVAPKPGRAALVPAAGLAKPARRTVKLVDPDEPVEAVDWDPAPYQLEASKFLQRHNEAGLFLDPGLRKTSSTLDAMCKLLKRKKAQRFLVIAPVRVCYMVWPAEIAKWKEFSHLRVEILHGRKKEEALRRDADVYLINPEGMDWLLGRTEVRHPKTGKVTIEFNTERFEVLSPDSLVVDEISKYKNSNSDRFKTLKSFLPGFIRRWGLTGSPAPNGLMDLFGLMYVIDLGYSLGQYITHYRNAYFKVGWSGFDWNLVPGAEKLIYKRIAPLVFRLEDRDYLKLPDLVLNVIKIELPAKARALYDALEKDFLVELDGGTVTAANAAVASGKCRQVASGGLFLPQKTDEDGRKLGKREWEDLHDAKSEVVRELVEELGGAQVLVAYDYEHDLARLLGVLGKDTPIVGGGTTPKRSKQLGDAWNAGKITELLVQPGAVAHGLNLQASNAQHIILHTPIWDFELYDQLVHRLLRSGNTSSKVFLHVLVARDTVDELIVTVTSKKDRTQGDFLAAMRDYTRRRLRQRKAA